MVILTIILVNPGAERRDEESAMKQRQAFARKASQSEAKEILELIRKKEQEYYADNGTYTKTLDELGIQLPPNANYSYTIERADKTTFVASAKGNIDNDPIEDFWIIDQTGKLRNIVNDLQN